MIEELREASKKAYNNPPVRGASALTPADRLLIPFAQALEACHRAEKTVPNDERMIQIYRRQEQVRNVELAILRELAP